MLGKLIKYEIYSNARIFLILYPVLIFVALINKLFIIMLRDVTSVDSLDILSIPSFAMGSIYTFLIIAIYIITILTMIQRFYKNLLGEEGYLMFTLPVKPIFLILAKLITSFLWFATSTFISILSAFILLPDYEWIEELWEFYHENAEEFEHYAGVNFELTIFLVCLFIAISVIFFILQAYTSMSIGNLANKNKILASFGAYVGIYAIIQTISTAIMFTFYSDFFVLPKVLETIEDNWLTYFLIIPLLVITLLSVGLFITTNLLLSKKLNLE